MNRRTRLIKLIHVAKRQMAGMDEAAYRDFLQTATGLESCAEMNIPQLQTVYSEMRKLGFRPVPTKRPRRYTTERIATERADDAQPLRAKINALLAANGLPAAYGDGIAKQMFGLDSWLFADRGQCRAIVAALVKRYGDKASG